MVNVPLLIKFISAGIPRSSNRLCLYDMYVFFILVLWCGAFFCLSGRPTLFQH